MHVLLRVKPRLKLSGLWSPVGTNIVVLSHNWESTKLRNLKVKKLAQNLFWWPDILNRK